MKLFGYEIKISKVKKVKNMSWFLAKEIYSKIKIDKIKLRNVIWEEMQRAVRSEENEAGFVVDFTADKLADVIISSNIITLEG